MALKMRKKIIALVPKSGKSPTTRGQKDPKLLRTLATTVERVYMEDGQEDESN
jgi:hypothetical protein